MMYHSESIRLLNALVENKESFVGGTFFQIGDIGIKVEGKDGLGGLIEEWLGAWAEKNDFQVQKANTPGRTQEFPDFFIGHDKQLLEIKCFDADAGANFDIANFDAYCSSLAVNPDRLFADYLIFSYSLDGSYLTIKNIWLKKIWEITCSSAKYPLKTQNKKGVIYNIRPASFYSSRQRYEVFGHWSQFVNALYETEIDYHELPFSQNELIFRDNLENFCGLTY